MPSESELLHRSDSRCELCKGRDALAVYAVPESAGQSDPEVLICGACQSQLADGAELDLKHWRCLADSMWSSYPAVQVLAWRLLKRMDSDNWAQDQLEMLYLDDDLKAWAEAGTEDDDAEAVEPTLDANGAALCAGDSVTIIKDLDVKGAGFVAKRGTAVRNISLTRNPEHIEGRVNGTRIVIIAAYVKKN
jgi:protein PhnA